MKSLYLDIFSGISGDMFIGAMIDLGVAPDRLETELRKLRLEGYRLHITRATKASIEGVKFDVHVEGAGDAHGEPHEPDQADTHSHEHRHVDQTHVHAHTHYESHGADHGDSAGHHDHLAGQTRGPHGGPLVETSRGRVEICVFEASVPPRFRLYFFDATDTQPTRRQRKA